MAAKKQGTASGDADPGLPKDVAKAVGPIKRRRNRPLPAVAVPAEADNVLTPQDRLFCAHFATLFNAAEAAIRAGLTENRAYASVVGAKQLAREIIQAEIAALTSERIRRANINAQRLVEEIAFVAFSDIGQCVDEKFQVLPLSQIPESARRAIAGIEVERIWRGKGDDAYQVEVTKLKFWNKNSAHDLLAKNMGLVRDFANLARKDASNQNMEQMDPRQALAFYQAMLGG